MTETETLLTHLEDGVLQITLNIPKTKNAFTQVQWTHFSNALKDAQENKAVACVLVTGAGGNFSSGVDLSDFNAEVEGEHPFDECARTLAFFDKPLIGAAQGVAVGGGATLLFHCDVLYVGESLRMRLPFSNLGLAPEFGSSAMLMANIGYRQAAELFFTSEFIDAARAVEVGIATSKIDDDKLLEHAVVKAKEIAQWPVSSLQETKRIMKELQRPVLEQALKLEQAAMDKLRGGPENMEAVMAFFEKRKPDFNKFR